MTHWKVNGIALATTLALLCIRAYLHTSTTYFFVRSFVRFPSLQLRMLIIHIHFASNQLINKLVISTAPLQHCTMDRCVYARVVHQYSFFKLTKKKPAIDELTPIPTLPLCTSARQWFYWCFENVRPSFELDMNFEDEHLRSPPINMRNSYQCIHSNNTDLCVIRIVYWAKIITKYFRHCTWICN